MYCGFGDVFILMIELISVEIWTPTLSLALTKIQKLWQLVSQKLDIEFKKSKIHSMTNIVYFLMLPRTICGKILNFARLQSKEVGANEGKFDHQKSSHGSHIQGSRGNL